MNEKQIDKLAELYSRDTTYAFIIATVCDEVLDKSGALLGEVRYKARERLNKLIADGDQKPIIYGKADPEDWMKHRNGG